MINIGIADDNQEFCQLLQDYFVNHHEINLSVIVHNGHDAVKTITETKVDVFLLDMVMPQMDGIGVLQWLSDNKRRISFRPKIIIFSAFGQEEITKQAIKLGADYYILKPFDLDVLARRILEIANVPKENVITNRRPVIKRAIEPDVITVMETLRIPTHFKGYAYLKDSIILTVHEPALINEITKKLYPVIADNYNTTVDRVERAMRFAIETAWNKGDVHTLTELFGYCVDDKKGKPTNASFIAKIADKIRLEKKIKVV